METKQYTPTLEDVKKFLDEYGWKYKEDKDDFGEYLSTPLYLAERDKVSILTLYLNSEFLMVNTSDLLTDIPYEYSKNILEYNDKIKLVKIFSKPNENESLMNVEVGFELWGEAFNKDTFFAFMDMLSIYTEYLLDRVEEDNIPCNINLLDVSH